MVKQEFILPQINNHGKITDEVNNFDSDLLLLLTHE
jgi:hypothetical protein